MKLLIVPTEFEFKILFPNRELPTDSSIEISPNTICLISGIGSTYSLIGLSNFSLHHSTLMKSVSKVLLLGIAGVYVQLNSTIQLGEVVQILSETDGNTGAQANQFLSAKELRWKGNWTIHFQESDLFNNLKKVDSLSVQACSGTKNLAESRKVQFGCEIENMEGHAVGLWAKNNHLEFSEIRAISNWVGDRDHHNWRVKEALNNLLIPMNLWINS
jgi:futalosine hydrolase